MPKIVKDEQIYRAALETIMIRGYSGATTKRIAEAANISEVTLFRKYNNKAELLRQALEAMVAQMDIETATAYTGDVATDLLRVVETYQGSAEKSGRFIYAILLEIPRNPELANVIENPLAMIQRIANLLKRYQDEGVLKHEHPLHAVTGLIGPLMAANLMEAVTNQAPVPPPNLSRIVAHFLNGRTTQ